MPRNRLRLDFSLQTAEERLDFLNSYLPTITFEPDEHEQETLSDYILWGKSEEGTNAQQEGDVILKEWATSKVDSIDGLMEIPGFQESKLKKLGSTHYSAPRTVFDRQEALDKASPSLRAIFEELFKQIDYIELVINYYDMKTGKRKNPPRETLLERFTPEDQLKCAQKAETINQRQYLMMRHRLVELRTEQYTYRDCISTAIMPHYDTTVNEENIIRFGEDIEVLPMGLYNNSSLQKKVFMNPPDPEVFTDEELQKISEWIWKKKTPDKSLNFEDPAHILALYKTCGELEAEGEEDPDQLYTAAGAIFKTLKFYEAAAHLNESQREILDMKVRQVPNFDIAAYINKKYGTTYNDNYISTIFRHKILQSIADAATYHRMIMENIFYPENFKRCKDCGRFYLRSPDFFMRQRKSPDGFSPRCKMCQKIKREEGKARNEIKYIVNGIDQ